jgi:DNA repair exonuclease SbcCD ATPase subunit
VRPLRNSMIVLFVSIMFFMFAGVNAVYAQSYSASWTLPLGLIVLALVVLIVVAAKFRWLQISVIRESAGTRGIIAPPEGGVSGKESTLGPLDILNEVKSEISAAVESMARERQRLQEHKSWVAQSRESAVADAQNSLNALRELAEKSKERSERLALEFARLKELHGTAVQEIQRLREELKVDREELDKVRERVTREHNDLRLMRAELEKERQGVEETLHEIAKEWELINVRREEMERARMDLIDTLASVAKARDEMTQELQETVYAWSGQN